MTPTEALREVKGFASANRIVYSRHARERMAQRSATPADVRHALTNANGCKPSDEKGRWVVSGEDLDGDELRVVVVVEDGCIVVTLF